MVVGFAQGLWLTGCVGRHVAQCSLNRVVGAFPLVVSRRGYGLQMGLKSSDEDHAAALEEKKQRVLTNPMPVVKLKKGKSKIFYDGNAIVLEGAIDCILGSESKIGPAAVLPLVDHNFSVIGWGVYNRSSKFRFRILHHVIYDGEFDISQQIDMVHTLTLKLTRSMQLRQMLKLPSEETDAFRLANSEGDSISGLIIDIYGNTAVVESSALWVEVHREEVERALRATLQDDVEIFWRQSKDKLVQEGMSKEELETGPNPSEARQQMVKEHRVEFEVELGAGSQKTGFFCDQRDNRARIAQLAKQKDVLDCFSYTGGFALHAAANGAKSVTAVESSKAALRIAEGNASRNRVNVDFKEADVFDFLKGAMENGQKWDIVVIDPPKYAPTQKSLERARRKYHGLNKRALSVTRSGGLLLSCSCSRAMTGSGKFEDMIASAAQDAGKRVTFLGTFGASPDHPNHPSMPETKYLTATLVAVFDT
eukprot:CAMPEP_0113961198 /NCGR_PEP_ID=MMETSP0011_2-20120614/5165_1 /TAXON_ID=101924 /ORGANISM="Rhodosorus marinus" /LENGTH=478 /DNA_ID=CAMNT_0000972791 /DNA_START=99 /DNA_END=1535 /DNA_ORIENTATION=+ /assembly_acc=CAM_ASM_000156